MLSIRKTHDLTHTWIASSFETLFAQIKTLRWRAVAGPAAAGPYSSYLSYLSHHLRTLFIRYILFLSLSLSFFFDSHPRIFSYYILATRLFYLSNSRAQSYFIFLYVSSFFLHIDFIDPGVRVWSNSIELAPFLEDLRVVLCFKGGNSPCKSIQMIGVYFNSPLKNVVHKKKKKKNYSGITRTQTNWQTLYGWRHKILANRNTRANFARRTVNESQYTSIPKKNPCDSPLYRQ